MKETVRNIDYRVILLLLVWLYVFCANFWMSDDAYITIKTVANFIDGYGLRFNIIERTQAYTHPLWMFHIAFFMLLLGDPVIAVFVLSFLCTALALWLLIYPVQSIRTRLSLLFLALISQAFVHYTSSGLENCLAFVLMGVIFGTFIKDDIENWSRKSLLLFLITCSLACCLRLDFIVLLGLPAGAVLISLWKKRRSVLSFASHILVAAFSLLAWHAFSFLYYGFFLPNTYYSKIGYLIDPLTRLNMGAYYFYRSLTEDSFTIFFIALIVCYSVGDRRGVRRISGISLALYLVYIIWMGGDFMMGRFFAVPFYICLLLAVSPLERMLKNRRRTIFAAGLLCIYSIIHPLAPFKTGTIKDPVFLPGPVENEQNYFYSYTNPFFGGETLVYDWKLEYLKKNDTHCLPEAAIGRLGYKLGKKIYIVDVVGLANPFLAHLAPDRVALSYNNFRPGHLFRRLPDGFMESCREGKNLIVNPVLQRYYEEISLITRGDIFDPERLTMLLSFNFGSKKMLDVDYDGKAVIDAHLVPVIDGIPQFEKRNEAIKEKTGRMSAD